MKKNIAVVGCGQWGKNLVRIFNELGSLSSICDPNEEIAHKYAKQYNVKKSTFIEIINDPNIKGVVITTPAYLHASMAIDAMKAKKHVLVEKPLALNVSDSKLMIEVAKKENVKLMVGHLLQYHPIFRTIRKLINAGEIGNLNYIYSNRLSFGKLRTKEDVIWSFAPHDISMILSLAGQLPELVSAKSISTVQKNLADIATIHLDFKSGLKSHISVSWLNPFKEVKLVLSGTKALVVFDDMQPWNKKLAIYPYQALSFNKLIEIKKSEVEYLNVLEEEPLKIECQHFVDIIENDIKPLTDGDEGLKVIKVLSAVSKSLTKNAIIKL